MAQWIAMPWNKGLLNMVNTTENYKLLDILIYAWLYVTNDSALFIIAVFTWKSTAHIKSLREYNTIYFLC